nr:H-NS family nucleoid-associated regulatory protein [Ralstonia sp. LMG 19083]
MPRSATELRQRAEAIVWIRTQITRHGLSYAQLQAAGCFGTARQRAGQAQYRNAQGQTWDGRSEMPEWLQRAIAAGQSAEHFRVT